MHAYMVAVSAQFRAGSLSGVQTMDHEEYMRRIKARQQAMQAKPIKAPTVTVGGLEVDRAYLEAAMVATGRKARQIKAKDSPEDAPSAIGRFSRPVYMQASEPVHKPPVKVTRRKQRQGTRASKCVTIYSAK